MKADIWKDRETGLWHWALRGCGLQAAGDSMTWQGAVDESFSSMGLLSFLAAEFRRQAEEADTRPAGLEWE